MGGIGIAVVLGLPEATDQCSEKSSEKRWGAIPAHFQDEE